MWRARSLAQNDALTQHERDVAERAVEMYRDHATREQIAKELDVDYVRVGQIVTHGLQQREKGPRRDRVVSQEEGQ